MSAVMSYAAARKLTPKLLALATPDLIDTENNDGFSPIAFAIVENNVHNIQSIHNH